MNPSHFSLGPLQQAAAHGASPALAYRLRMPQPAHARGCVFLLHGVGGQETDLAELAAALDPALKVVLLRGPLVLAPQQFGWFRVAFTAQGPVIDAAQAEASRLSLVHFVRALTAAQGIEPRHTVIAGFSQGGIMSASLALTEPEQVGGFAILSGRILPEIAAQVASAERLVRLRAFVSHGQYDRTLPVSWAERAEHWLAELGVALEAHRYPADHALSAAMRCDFVAWAHQLMPSQAELLLGSEAISLRLSPAALRTAPPDLPLGTALLARHFFAGALPRAALIDEAIMTVEDALALWRGSLPAGTELVSREAGLHEIARVADPSAAALPIRLSREAVEHTFSRLAAVIQGRPASAEGLPEQPEFAARLLVLRELMHHLNIAYLTVLPAY